MIAALRPAAGLLLALLATGPAGDARAPLKGHQHTITCLAFAPDGRLLASGSKDTTVRLWDLATGQPVATLEGHVDMVTAVAFAPDGKTLASCSHGNVIHLWDAAGNE